MAVKNGVIAHIRPHHRLRNCFSLFLDMNNLPPIDSNHMLLKTQRNSNPKKSYCFDRRFLMGYGCMRTTSSSKIATTMKYWKLKIQKWIREEKKQKRVVKNKPVVTQETDIFTITFKRIGIFTIILKNMIFGVIFSQLFFGEIWVSI